MSLENEIKQEKFTSEYQKLSINIAFTHGYMTSLMCGYLKPYGLSVQQYNVLRILRGQYPKPVSINSITDRMIDKMSNASRLVEKLRLKTMIERSKCSHDKRQVDVQLTTKGLDVLAEIDDLLPLFEQNFTHIKTADAKLLNKILDELRK